MLVAVTCPRCRRCFVVSGRGRCRCGAYLAHHWSGKYLTVGDPDNTWLFMDGKWVHYKKMKEEEA